MQRPLPENTQHTQGFETTVPASERLQTYASDRAATRIG